MGMLIRGQWSTQWYTPGEGGSFEREATRFRDRVTADGSSGHPAVAGRYHLYIAWACPWAHRTALIRTLRGLESAIGMSVVDAVMGDDGWSFGDDLECTPDALFGARYLREIYVRADPEYTGRVTVPVLWDREKGTIVCNESREILRMLDVEFEALARPGTSFCPPELRARIDAVLDDIYPAINNGVYRAGFASEQGAYDEAVTALFAALDRWDAHLGGQRYLCGDRPTEADLCMFTTLVRFDAVYHGHFKCNLRRIADYPNLSNYLRDLYQLPGVAPLCKLDQIKAHYYRSHPQVNPSRIVPAGPLQDLGAPHDRARFA